MPKSKCPTKWKRVYADKAEAAEVAARLRRNNSGARAQEAYQCAEGHWHVGNGKVRRHAQAVKRRQGTMDKQGRRRR